VTRTVGPAGDGMGTRLPPGSRLAPDAGVYVMSVAAELAGLHPQTLRVYERRGLLEPARTDGGTRRYSHADLARLHRIGELTGVGVNLEGVRRILDLEAELAAVTAELARVQGSAGAVDPRRPFGAGFSTAASHPGHGPSSETSGVTP